MNRGRRGQAVFKSEDDYQRFIDILHEAVELFSLRISAYCLMTNHYHLLVETPDANLSRCMRHINGITPNDLMPNKDLMGSCFGDGTK